VIPSLAQQMVRLYEFSEGRGSCLYGSLGRLLFSGSPRLFPINIDPVVRRVVSSSTTALRLFSGSKTTSGVVGAPHATHRGAYTQLRCVCQKRWQRMRCCGPFGATYFSTDIRKPQSSVSDGTLDTSDKGATETMKWSVGGRFLAGS
jgi:hypothetical protein